MIENSSYVEIFPTSFIEQLRLSYDLYIRKSTLLQQ